MFHKTRGMKRKSYYKKRRMSRRVKLKKGVLKLRRVVLQEKSYETKGSFMFHIYKTRGMKRKSYYKKRRRIRSLDLDRQDAWY